MTYLNSRPHDISASETDRDTLAPHSGAMTAPSPLRVMITTAIIHILARLSKTRAPAKRKMLVAALMFFTALHGGTRSEKRAFLKRLIDRNEEIQNRLAARYKVWRQRKCWMWGAVSMPAL